MSTIEELLERKSSISSLGGVPYVDFWGMLYGIYFTSNTITLNSTLYLNSIVAHFQ
jgi:hypothetical protein